MRHLILVRSLIVFAVAFFIGSLFGEMIGFDATVSGFVFLGLSAVVQLPKGSLAAGLDVSQVVTDLGAYIQSDYNLTNIWKRAMQQMEFESFMFKKSGVRGKFSFLDSSSTEVLQPFQKAWTPKGLVEFDPYINEAFHQKIDFTIDSIDDVFDGYMNFMGDETKLRKDWPLVRYIIEQHIMPRVVEELNIQSAQGVYAAPTPGTAGASIAGSNGILTKIAAEITATNLTPITTGAITSANAVNKVETFLDAIDDKVLAKCKYIFVNKTIERNYMRNYRTLFGSTNAAGTKGQLKLDDYNLELVGLDAFAGKNRMMTTTEGNLVVGFDKLYMPNKMDVQQDKRVVNIMADFVRGYGFRTLNEVFVNDQV